MCSCPGCDHDEVLHAGGWCYHQSGLLLDCGLCGWLSIDRPEFRGWWDARQGPFPGARFLAVPIEADELSTSAAILEAARLVGHPEP